MSELFNGFAHTQYRMQQTAINKIAEKHNLLVFRPENHAMGTYNITFLFTQSADPEKNFPVWSFENKNPTGKLDMDVGKLMKNRWIDLTADNWEERMEQSVLLSMYEQMEQLHVNAAGGYFFLPEADEILNEINRQKIEALAKMYDKAFLIKLQAKPEDTFVPYSGQKIYNFEFDCVVPCITQEITDLYEKQKMPDRPVNVTWLLLDAVNHSGGISLIWR